MTKKNDREDVDELYYLGSDDELEFNNFDAQSELLRESTLSPPPLPSPVRAAVSRESTASPPPPNFPSPVAPATR